MLWGEFSGSTTLLVVSFEDRLLNFLLAYNSCWGRIHCDISICAYNISWLDSPPPSLPLIPLPPFLEQFQQVSFCFHTWIQNVSTIFTLLRPFLMLPPSHLYPHWDRICFSFLSFIFLSAYQYFKEGLPWYFRRTYHAFEYWLI
jgi:hypothetical protein